jgi:outer membrane lipoprotein-sorting protein
MFSKITRIFFILVIASLFMLAPVYATQLKPVPEDHLKALLEKIEDNFSGIKTLKTLLTQEKNIAMFSEPVISNGFCIFKAPNKLRLEFTKPFKSSLIVNGNQVLKYEYFNGEWQKLDSGDKEILLLIMDNIASWLRGQFKDTDLYDIKAFENENLKILLVPKAKEFRKFIASFELGLNREMNGLAYIIINETKNNYTKITFHDDEMNTDIPDMLFEDNADKPHPISQW